MSRVPVLLVLLLAAAISSARPLDPPRPNEKWLTLRVDEFTLVSNVSAAETSAIARDLLRMRNAIGELTRLRVRSSKPTRIFVFGNERGFAPYREAVLRQTSESITGAFITGDNGNFIVMKRDAGQEIDRTIYHELTHYFVRNTVAGLPLWASEGIAEYYSTFATSGDWVYIGRPITPHVQWLREETLIPLRDLFATTMESPIYNEGSRQGVFYAQSWALFHFLMVDDARRAQFGRYLKLVGEGQPVDEAFAAAFETTYSSLELELRAYVRKRAFTYSRYSLETLEVPDVPKPEAMSRDAVLYELGHLLTHASQASAEAERFLNEALSLNPQHAGAHADIGRLQQVAGRLEDAEASFERAIRLGSSDPEIHVLAGLSALEATKGIREVSAPTPSLLKAREAFRRSTELDPTSALAWTGIGMTYVFSDEDPAAGIAALEKSLTLAPGDVDAAFHLVQLYARVERTAEARRLIDTVLARGARPEMLDFARDTMRRADEVAKDNRTIRMINDAIAKANAGKLDEAIAVLDELLPQLDDPAMLSSTKELRAQMASAAKKR